MSDTQAREEFEKWWYETKQIHLQPHDYEIPTVLAPWEAWLNCWNIAHAAGRKAGLEEAKAIASERARKFWSASFGSGKERASGAESAAYHIDKTIKALITKPGEKA